MTSLETPRHRVEGLGASHSGVQQFWRLRVSGAALALLSLWFGFAALGLVGGNQVSVLAFLQHPVNAVLMGAFMLLSSYHMTLGLREVIEDYVHASGMKIFLLLLSRVLGFAVAIAVTVALLRITIA
ncbi:MAG: succinate dehydrogenase, hydrophobic membrane anchor protein [Alphaproteobacteria bacterium]|nr:succinate dehydrogenase, hydrophobic membrane anchor protein [Alphaproteobacteria bacterium]